MRISPLQAAIINLGAAQAKANEDKGRLIELCNRAVAALDLAQSVIENEYNRNLVLKEFNAIKVTLEGIEKHGDVQG